MRHYEIVLLVHPDQSEQVPQMLERYQSIIDSTSGKTHRSEDWGRRQIAYPINKIHKAHYVMLNIECNLDALAQLKHAFKYNDSILRDLILLRKEAITDVSVMLKPEDDKASEQAA